MTLIVRKALSAVARVHGRFGLQLAAKLLHGSEDARLSSTGLSDTRTFGALRDHSELWITRVLRRCVTAGWVDFSGGDRPVLVLTPSGRAVMKGDHPATLLLPATGTPAAAQRGQRRGAASGAESELDASGQALFEALRRHRLEVARELGTPPYVVASDRTLRDLARLRPRSPEELTLAHGVGPAKAKRFGEGWLEVIRGVDIPEEGLRGAESPRAQPRAEAPPGPPGTAPR